MTTAPGAQKKKGHSRSPATADPRGVRPLRHGASSRRLRNVVALASGKGGVGKTWLALALAQTCARKGENVLLVDGDLALANIDVQLGLQPAHDLSDVLHGRRRLSDAVVTVEDGPFDLIAGRSGSGALAGLPPARLAALGEEIAGLARGYDRVVIDLGAGLEGGALLLSDLAGLTLVVTVDEPTAVTDAYAFIKSVAARDPRADIRLIVNRAPSARDARLVYDRLNRACSAFLHLSPRLAGIVHEDPNVADAIRHQQGLLQRHPMTVAAMDVDQIRARLLAVPPGAPPQPLAAPDAALSSG